MGVPVAVLGAGSFGSCLALLCGQANEVSLFTRDTDTARAINETHSNPRYLRDIDLPTSVQATTSLEEAVTGRELIVVAVPSESVREVMSAAAPYIAPEAILVSAVKGIEYETGMLMHQVLEDVLPEEHHARIACLSGPSFAREIANRLPTVVTVACREEAFAIAVQATLSCPWFRCYSDSDIIGVETGGALKNVIALAVGIGDGQRQGHNSRAALMTRGLAEITRLGVALGAVPATFLGLSGMGDLVLTCTGDLSRNRRVGIALGEGRALEEILADLDEVAEGVGTTRAACRLGERLGVELPIAQAVRSVLDGDRSPEEAGRYLMLRQLRSEKD